MERDKIIRYLNQHPYLDSRNAEDREAVQGAIILLRDKWEERKVGHWIIEGFENEISCCSECHTEFPLTYELDALGIEMNYCPNCGAKMK